MQASNIAFSLQIVNEMSFISNVGNGITIIKINSYVNINIGISSKYQYITMMSYAYCLLPL